MIIACDTVAFLPLHPAADQMGDPDYLRISYDIVLAKVLPLELSFILSAALESPVMESPSDMARLGKKIYFQLNSYS